MPTTAQQNAATSGAPQTVKDGLWTDQTGTARCAWCRASPLYRDYHDSEWGFPVTDDQMLFEKICLEGFQAGLSWLTILNKRDNFRRAFADFDYRQVAKFSSREVEGLLQDSGIVRHRGKIESTINNARRMHQLVEDFGSLCTYAWLFEPDANVTPDLHLQIPVSTLEAGQLSADLRRRGWTFVGPTTMYAFMQAMGLVNDHLSGCSVASSATRERLALEPA